MSRLGLFPLPLVLVPTERLPLHIFEPRYKELIGECLTNGTEFGVVLSADGGEAHDVGTRASIVEVLIEHPDGSMDIVVEGGERFHLVETHYDRTFLSGTVEDVIDVEDDPEDLDVGRVLALYDRLIEAAGEDEEIEPLDGGSGLLDWEITARADLPPPAKQELLELTSPRRRYAILAERLESAIGAAGLRKLVSDRAAHNGRVVPHDEL